MNNYSNNIWDVTDAAFDATWTATCNSTNVETWDSIFNATWNATIEMAWDATKNAIRNALYITMDAAQNTLAVATNI